VRSLGGWKSLLARDRRRGGICERIRPKGSRSRRRGAPTLAKPVHQIRFGRAHFLATNELLSTRGHLLRNAAPLSLAPLVFCAHSDKTSRHEVFVARRIASLEPGGKVEGVAVASTEVMRVG
jgi:hypothetical protein